MRVKVCSVGLICLAFLWCLTSVSPVVAQPTNGNFETGDYTGWTVIDGTAFGTGPSNGARTNKEGTWSVDSHMAGDETLGGTLRSDTFALSGTGKIDFLIAGHNYWPGTNDPFTWDYVTLNLASDNSEIARVWAPGNDAFVAARLDGSAQLGQNAYIQVVDNGDLTAFAWLAVDNFHFFTAPAPTGINGNGSFETGDYTGWTVVEGDAWGTGPSTGGVHSTATGYDGFYCADSFTPGEAAVGILRSNNFTLTGTGKLSFLIAGCNYYPGYNEPNSWNYAVLKRASDNFEIGKVFAPQANEFQKRVIDASAYKNVPLYFEVVDDGDQSGYAWIAVDKVEELVITTYPAEGINGNGNFELGNYTGWTVVEGDCWGTEPVLTGSHAAATGFEGSYCADSILAGEAAVGILRSSNFTLTSSGILSFLIAGCNYYPNYNEPNSWNWVELKRASDNLVIERVYAPQANEFSKRTIDAKAYKNVPLYLEVVDNGDQSGYAWIAIDNVREADIPSFPATGINGNGNFELGDFTAWNVIDGTAWGTKPVVSGSHATVTNPEGSYYADSFIPGELQVGTLRSNTFTLSKEAISVMIAGFNHYPDRDPVNSWNYVALKKANGTEIGRAWAPGDNTFSTLLILAKGMVGQSVYVEAVDDAADTGYAWMAIDNVFETDPPAEPTNVFDDFETGTIDPAKWTQEGDTWKAQAAGQGFGAAPYQGDYKAASCFDGANSTDGLVGTMTSVPITVGPTDGWIAFYMQGWDSMTGGAGQNYVDITTAGGTLIQRVTPPLKDGWQLDVQVPVAAYRGQQIRMVCVDGRSDGFGWIGVDYIRMIPGEPPLAVEDWNQY
jgi:hypothetical protein